MHPQSTTTDLSLPLMVAHATAMGIYAITHIATGRQYIGSAVDIKSRWRVHRCELSKHRHHNIKLQNAWNKYGADAFAFTVLETVRQATDLIPAEQRWLDEARPHYNVMPKAGSILGSKRAPATIEKMRLAGLRQTRRSGYKLSAEMCAKLSAAHRGWRPSEAQRRRQSQTCLEQLDAQRLAAEAGIEGAVLGIKDAAKLAGFTRSGISKLIHEGAIPATKVGRIWIIRRSDFDALLPALLERRAHRRCPGNQGAKRRTAKLKDADVLSIRARYGARTCSARALASEYGVCLSHVWAIIHRRVWKHI